MILYCTVQGKNLLYKHYYTCKSDFISNFLVIVNSWVSLPQYCRKSMIQDQIYLSTASSTLHTTHTGKFVLCNKYLLYNFKLHIVASTHENLPSPPRILQTFQSGKNFKFGRLLCLHHTHSYSCSISVDFIFFSV